MKKKILFEVKEKIKIWKFLGFGFTVGHNLNIFFLKINIKTFKNIMI